MRLIVGLFWLSVILPGVELAAQGIAPGGKFSIRVQDLRVEKGEEGTLQVPMHVPLPSYPSEMYRAGIDGKASVRFLVHADGSVSDVEIVTVSQKEFGAPTKDAVAQWHFGSVFDPRSRKHVTAWVSCALIFRCHEQD